MPTLLLPFQLLLLLGLLSNSLALTSTSVRFLPADPTSSLHDGGRCCVVAQVQTEDKGCSGCSAVLYVNGVEAERRGFNTSSMLVFHVVRGTSLLFVSVTRDGEYAAMSALTLQADCSQELAPAHGDFTPILLVHTRRVTNSEIDCQLLHDLAGNSSAMLLLSLPAGQTCLSCSDEFGALQCVRSSYAHFDFFLQHAALLLTDSPWAARRAQDRMVPVRWMSAGPAQASAGATERREGGADVAAYTVGVVLTVYKRSHLEEQFLSLFSQTLRPARVHVYQNEEHVSVEGAVDRARIARPDFNISFTRLSMNTRFHGRFHLAATMQTDFVSVWDDDIVPGRDWLRSCVDYSLAHGHALVGCSGRNILRILHDHEGHALQEEVEDAGAVDFVGQCWTIWRDHLQHFLHDLPLTLATGEDVQLAFSLQRRGIEIHQGPVEADAVPDEQRGAFAADQFASHLNKKAQNVRQLLFCRLLKEGFQLRKCANCDAETVEACVRHFRAIVEIQQDVNNILETSRTTRQRRKRRRRRAVFMFATRAELIKLFPIVRIAQSRRSLRTSLVRVGQDQDALLDLNEFELQIDRQLVVPASGSSTLGQMVELLDRRLPLTRGDLLFTASTSMLAMAAGVLGLSSNSTVVHVGSGAAGGGRGLADEVRAQEALLAGSYCWHFTTSEEVRESLVRAGISPARVVSAGNTVLDAVRIALPLIRRSTFQLSGLVNQRQPVFLHLKCPSRTLGAVFAQFDCGGCFFVLMRSGIQCEDEEQFSSLCKMTDRVVCLSPSPFSEVVSISTMSILILIDSEELLELCSLLGKPTILLSREYGGKFESHNIMLVQSSDATSLLHAMTMGLRNTSDGSLSQLISDRRDDEASEFIYRTVTRQSWLLSQPLSSQPTPSYRLALPVHKDKLSVRQTAFRMVLKFLSEAKIRSLVDLDCKLGPLQRQKFANVSCLGNRVVQRKQDVQKEATPTNNSQGGSKFQFWPIRDEDIAAVDNLLVVDFSVDDVNVDIQLARSLRLLSRTGGSLVHVWCSTTEGAGSGAVNGSYFMHGVALDLVNAEKHAGNKHTCSLLTYRKKTADEDKKSLCWIQGRAMSFSQNMVALLHALSLSTSAGMILILPDSVHHREIFNRWHALFLFDPSSVRTLGHRDFQRECEVVEVLGVLDLLAQRWDRTVGVDAQDCLDTREVTLTSLKGLYRSLRFPARLLQQVDDFIAQQLGGGPFIAVHVTDWIEECVLAGGREEKEKLPGAFLSARAAACNHRLPDSIRRAERQLGREGVNIFVTSGDEPGSLEEALGEYVGAAKFYDAICEGFECVATEMLICVKSDVFVGNTLNPFALSVGRLRETRQVPKDFIFPADEQLVLPLWHGYPDSEDQMAN